MSGMEDKSRNKDEDNSQINKDVDSHITDAVSEGNVGFDSGNTETIGAYSQNMPQSASGDSTEDFLQKNTLESDKKEIILTEKSGKTDLGEGSGDHISNITVSKEANNKNDNEYAMMKMKEASTSLDIIGVKDNKTNKSSFAKCDTIEPMTGDRKIKSVDEFSDDEMELRWDDDCDVDLKKPDSHKFEDILSEEDFFDETNVNAEGYSNRSNRDGDILAEKNNLNAKPDIDTEDILSEEEFLDETDMKVESSKTVAKNDTIAEKKNPGNDRLEDILSEDEFVEEIDITPEMSETVKEIGEKSKEKEEDIKEPKVNSEIKADIDVHSEQRAVDNINAETSELNQEKDESEINTEDSKMIPAVKIVLEQNIGSNPDILTVESKQKDGHINGEDKLLKDIDTKDLNISSDRDISLEKNVDNNILEANLLKETETNLEKEITIEKQEELNKNKLKKDKISYESENKSDKVIAKVQEVEDIDNTLLEETETNVTTSEIIANTEIMNEVEDANLEDKLLEGTDITEIEVNPVIDISMEKVNDENEEELLRDDQNESFTMDVDNTYQSIDDRTKSEGNNIDQSIVDTNKTEQTVSSPSEIDTGANIPNVEIGDVDKILDKSLEDKSNSIKVNQQLSTVTETSGQKDFPESIKSVNCFPKPDVMLEIFTKDLMDMDDTDLSMNLDQSKDIDVKVENMECEENIVIKETEGEESVVTESRVDKVLPDNTNIANVEESTEKVNKVTENVNEGNDDVNKANESVNKDTENVNNDTENIEKIVKETIEESIEKIFAKKDVAELKETTNKIPDIIPETSSKMTPDTSDEVPEVSDSLGLLAESSGRVMEDDEEPEDDDDGDDDDDFDQDESSNVPSPEQSEETTFSLEIEPRDHEEKENTPGMTVAVLRMHRKSVDDMDMEMKVDFDVPDDTVDEETRLAVTALLKHEDDEIDVDEGPQVNFVDEVNEDVEVNEDSTDQQFDIETVKLSDTSDNEAEDKDKETAQEDQTVSIQSKKDTEEKSPSKQSPNKLSDTQSPSKQSSMKIKKLEITTIEPSAVVNIVDLEESSSSEDDIQEVDKEPALPENREELSASHESGDVTDINIPTSIEVMCTSGGTTSEIVTKEGELVITGIPKPPPLKPARLNTSEVTIKTVTVDPQIKLGDEFNEETQTNAQSIPKLSLEIFNLDSDDEENSTGQSASTSSSIIATILHEKSPVPNKCINDFCKSYSNVMYIQADAVARTYYNAGRKKRAMVCVPCAEVLEERTKKLVADIKATTPLLDLDMSNLIYDLVEISDSESEDDDMKVEIPKKAIGEKAAKLLNGTLAARFNEVWRKYDLDTKLRETQIMLDDEIEKLEQDQKEINAILNDCQTVTDKLRRELYSTFEIRREETPALSIYDTPDYKYIGPEDTIMPPSVFADSRRPKRRMPICNEKPAKRAAIPLGYAPLDADTSQTAKETKSASDVIENSLDDDKDISVVKLSAESAPADLPPPGELSRPPLRVSMPVYAMKNTFGPWLKGKILEVQPKNLNQPNSFTVCRVKFDHKTKTNGKVLPARCVAYAEPADVRMTIGTRLIALFKDSNKRESYYSGVVAEIPNPVNNYRYLVFFDDGYAQYVQHAYTRLVCESSPLVWEEVHPFSRDFVKQYLLAYPARPMVRLHEGQHLKTEWDGKWWPSRVTKVDASLAQVLFVGDGRREWIYRGSTRLAPLYLELRAAERHRPRPMPRSKAQPRSNMPYVEYTRSDEQDTSKQQETEAQQQNEEIRRQRAVAKKSTTVSQTQAAPTSQQQPAVPGNLDGLSSRVVYYTPKNVVKPYKMIPHKCTPKCKRSDVLSLKELRTYNPLAKPLLSGWERQIVRFKGNKEVMYRAPCGRRLRNMRELHAYLRATASDLPVDLFDFQPATHCLAEFVLNRCHVAKKDLSHGKENVPVPCINYYDESLPEFCSYNTERTPTAGVPLNLDPEFLCGCDCTDDCQDKSKCACWKMTLEGARTIGLSGPNVGYVYKRLPEPLPSGIYECNSRCKCKHTCLNRVAQHPLQLKLQVFKTLNRGWGIRALNDVPKGAFLCVYAGNLLTDATANLDGLNEGDEYLAELDYIEVVEQMKEGYEEDIPEADKKLDKKETEKDDDNVEDEEPSSSDDEDTGSKTDKEDDDFRPGSIGLGVAEFNKRLRRREKLKKDKEGNPEEEKEKENKETDKDSKEKDANAEEDCITISDDEEVREPSRFMVQAGMGANEFISKYKSVRTLFGKDEACYIMDAKVQGNIGRYLNHSCCPNVFVQNVFVDTHDPRFPWVAFFALSHIKCGTELTWNYNYDVGSVPGKILYCYCGAPNCRGRLL